MDALPDPRARLEAYARQNLPRYTSYPTAPHFGPLAEATYRDWLKALARDRPEDARHRRASEGRESPGPDKPGDTLSLYLHVPFCKELCWYCGCHTAITRNEGRLARYADALVREIDLVADALPAWFPVESLHFGGGTPSAIGAEALGRVMAALRAGFGFRDDAELSVELDPRTLDDDVVEMLGRAGFNRASLGVQDMDAAVQKLCGRIQPPEMVESAVRRLRGAGIDAINFDLMYGLPGQDCSHVEASARFAAAMGASRVAVFGYAHVPWMKPAQKAIREDLLPDTFARMEQADAAERALLAAGYVAIGLDHFALPDDPMAVAARAGALKRNFQGYTTDRAPVLLGLGASAIGALPQGYAQNIADERAWIAAVNAGSLPVARGLELTEDDRTRRGLIEGVMCDLALDLARVPKPVWETAEPRLAPMLRDGLARIEGGRLEVTETGRRFVRHVAACFDARLAASQARHSRAV